MKNDTVKIDGKWYTRVTKKTALQAVKAGTRVLAYMINANICSPWIEPVDITDAVNRRINADNISIDVSFRHIIGDMLYYNSCSELGYYLKFYAKQI